jgi:alginate O-acetyltransferase complex protein AlgI
LVFVFSGLWHGASWNFVLWGAYQGTFLILERIFLEKLLLKAGKFISIPFTFLVTVLGWVIFRIESLPEIGLFYSKLFSFTSFKFIYIEYYDTFVTLLVAAFFSFFTLSKLGRITEKLFFYRQMTMLEKTIIFLISVLLFVLCVGSLAVTNFNPFIYFRF